MSFTVGETVPQFGQIATLSGISFPHRSQVIMYMCPSFKAFFKMCYACIVSLRIIAYRVNWLMGVSAFGRAKRWQAIVASGPFPHQ